MLGHRLGLALALGGLLVSGAQGAPAEKLDLADTAAGVYQGDVISDARGSSHADVRITVAKTGPNTVRVSSDYARLPAFTFKLTRAMSTIQNTGGLEVFLLDLSKQPPSLDLTIDDASWSGVKAPGAR